MVFNSGSGGNTELRAQIRKEREASRVGNAGKAVREPSTASSSVSISAFTTEAKTSLSEATLASSLPLSSASSTDYEGGPESAAKGTDPFAETVQSSSIELPVHCKAPTVGQQSVTRSETDSDTAVSMQQTHPATSTASKRLSTGSAVLAAVRKLEEDARARDIAHQTFRVQRSGSISSIGDAPTRVARVKGKDETVEVTGGMRPTVTSSRDLHQNIEQPPESFDQSFGLEALQAAFSAKYYELAHKCKNWEKYAAQLRARAEALDVDVRILKESNASQQRHIVFLEAENSNLKDQSDVREMRAREVEQRLTLLEQRLGSQAFHTGLGTVQTLHYPAALANPQQGLHTVPESSTSNSSSPHNRCESRETTHSLPISSEMTAFHSSNLLDVPEEHQTMRAPTPLQTLSSLPRSSTVTDIASVADRLVELRVRNSSAVQNRRDSIVAEDAALREYNELWDNSAGLRSNGHAQRDSSQSGHLRQDSRSSDTASAFGTSAYSAIGHGGRPQAYPHPVNAQGAAFSDRIADPSAPVLRSCASFVRVRPSHGPRSVTSPAQIVSMAGQKRPPTMESALYSAPMSNTGSVGIYQQQQQQPQQHTGEHPQMGYHRQYQAKSVTTVSGALPKRRSNNSMNPNAMQSSASLSTLYLGPAQIAHDIAMSASRSLSSMGVHRNPGMDAALVNTAGLSHGLALSGARPLSGNEATGFAQPLSSTSETGSGQSVEMSASSSQNSEGLSSSQDRQRRLRRTSLNQQQQFAQMQAQREAAFNAAGGYATREHSRSASRMSTMSTEGGTGANARQRSGSSNKAARSRAGSASVHDSIPAVKDDLFSEGNLTVLEDAVGHSRVVSHSQSHPALGPRTSLSSLTAPPLSNSAIAHANVRRQSPLVPFSNLTNIDHLAHRPLAGGQVGPSHSDGALQSGKPVFGRTVSANSMSSSGATGSSVGQIGHGAGTVSSVSSGTLSHSHHPSSLSLSSRSSQPSIGRAAGQSSEGPILGVLSSVPYLLSDGATAANEIEEEKPAHPRQESAASGLTSETSQTELENDLPTKNEDSRGAHRRLYEALRDELSAEHLVKFERYVHRYDALEIPIDGPRGLVNRVQHLLIRADPSLAERPADYRRRKRLAREFERIVRVDLGEASVPAA
ncbi:unnamed protein product [Parajaminaea phylloscopi]